MGQLEKVSLGVFPTPIRHLGNLSRLPGTNVSIKRGGLFALS